MGIRYSKSGQFGMELITVSFFLLLTLRFLVHFMAWVNMQNTVLFKNYFIVFSYPITALVFAAYNMCYPTSTPASSTGKMLT